MCVGEKDRIGQTVEWAQLQKRLYRMGVNRSYQGFGMSLEAAFLLKRDESLRTCMKGVYIDVALRNRTSRENVIRNIRTLIQKIWYCGDREELMELAGRCLKKPPTCNEFIGILEDFLKRKEGSA